MNDIAPVQAVMKGKWEAMKRPSVVLANRAKFADLDEDFWPLYERVHEKTLTSVERLYDLYKTVEYVVKARIPGSIVECGVWAGGSMMMVALALQHFGDTSRKLYLFDTYEGLPYPESENDVDLIGNHAAERWREGWIKVDLDTVKANMASTGYPMENIEFVKGMVEDTLRLDVGKYQRVAIARLDTDWEKSTAWELQCLWPLIPQFGFLIVDDYGHWLGAKVATDEFFANRPVKMHRIDYSCRSIQK